ncbi:MAG: general secretion pathway protein GspF [Gammaproteobacteria bacterium]|nr:general secretion pathway protein GspF [Gammaproteobacteria bacterium]
MTKKPSPLTINEPLRHRDHSAPLSRRDFLRQGFITGTGAIIGGGVFSLFSNPHTAYAAVSADLDALATDIGCSLGGLSGPGKIPFICFDLAGGANLASSNVLVGQSGGQMDFLDTSGYSKMGLPGDMIPGLADTTVAATMLNGSDGNFTNSQLGLRFHSDSAMLKGILDKFTSVAPGLVDGAVIAARSDNDTGNNPHNPMYGIAKAGAQGGVVTLIGSQSSDSGGNSMSPASLINPEIRPTKVDRPSDVTGMVDTGDLTAVLSDPADVTAVMESIARISHKKLSLGSVTPGINITQDDIIKDLMRCGYLKAADIADRFAGVDVNPEKDAAIRGATGIFSTTEFDNDSEFRKTASVMKMVIDGHAGAGSITMGGYDYHTGDRQTGENRDLRAGRCIGACLQYALIRNKPLMIYVFSDGSLSSNGALDNSSAVGSNELGGRGKGQWTSDNSSTACSFYLVIKPNSSISTYANTGLIDYHQIGRFSADGSVITSSSPAANNVNLLVNTVIANFMSINGDLGQFTTLFPNHGLGNIDNMISFGAF